MKKITINDIAKELGVTPSTVSRALAGNTRVSEKTRKLVADKAQEMGYEPNVMAASLRKGKSDTIGLVVPRINRHFFSNVISGVEEVLNPAGYNLVICQTGEDAEKERKAVATLLRNRVGGIILSLSVQTGLFDHLDEVVSRKVPLVQFDRINPDVEGDKIVNDNFSGAYMAVRHLLEEGYRHIVHFAGDLGLRAYAERFDGYKKAMEEAGLEVLPSMVFENTITRDAGYEAMGKLLADQKADAVFCAGDYSALGAIECLKAKGVKIPGDFGVVGYANEPFAELMYPSLTTVEQNAFVMGNKAASAMIRCLEGKAFNMEEVVPVSLIKRESSGKRR
ncbi:LacI family transcriptional regulator [Marinilabiliaceae bacterium JC017]|nr:LacI family transcriptional regulator [Marinilabiliaceae bacterium JC017]